MRIARRLGSGEGRETSSTGIVGVGEGMGVGVAVGTGLGVAVGSVWEQASNVNAANRARTRAVGLIHVAGVRRSLQGGFLSTAIHSQLDLVYRNEPACSCAVTSKLKMTSAPTFLSSSIMGTE